MAVLAELRTTDIPATIVSQHWLHTRTGDDRELIVLSGNALVSIDNDNNSGQWLRGEVRLFVQIGPGILPPGKVLRARQSVVVVNPSSTWIRDQLAYNGFAVDTFKLVDWQQPEGIDSIEIQADVAVMGGWLYRISYHVTLLGEFVDEQLVS